MPVVVLNIPSIAIRLIEIIGFVGIIEGNAPITLETYINNCFTLKPSQDCDTLILEDHTDYKEILSDIDLDDVEITVNFGSLSDCDCSIVNECPVQTILPNSITSFSDLESDGIYCAEITITYTLLDITYSRTIKSSFNKDCCDLSYKELSLNVWGRMSDIACTITKLSKIGRNITSLKKSYLKLSNLLWLYYNSVDSCNERDKVFCLFNKIK